jgi:hypothetical protein
MPAVDHHARRRVDQVDRAAVSVAVHVRSLFLFIYSQPSARPTFVVPPAHVFHRNFELTYIIDGAAV